MRGYGIPGSPHSGQSAWTTPFESREPTNASTKKDNTTIGDLFKDVWGHLPLNKRQEMDAYARERFLPKYDEILRQYYRTISEQGRHKDGE